MSFNVLGGVNYELLDKKIEEYQNKNNGKVPYIFMNEFTIDKATFGQVGIGTKRHNYFDVVFEYKNCFVYCNNLLENGEVELR